jgi:excisionase family DNA binding protein
MDSDLMTPDEVCAYLRVTKDWLYDQVQARRIPHLRLGRHLRFLRTEIHEYLALQAVPLRRPENKVEAVPQQG